MAKSVTKYVCQKCGYASVKWLGKCPECGAWDSLVEEVDAPVDRHRPSYLKTAEHVAPKTLREVDKVKVNRIPTGITEFDRVLGGGIVPGSLILLGGAPGIGKSTITLDVSMKAANRGIPVLYVSGEESEAQTAMRAERLGTASDALKVMTATELGTILVEARKDAPKLLVIDSIQTMYNSELETAAGSVGQVRECTAKLLNFAKESNIAIIIIGHVTKEGNIAGPRLLEHMVDVVLQFEGDRSYTYRVLRALKNRFGSTSECGIFSMEAEGLQEVSNPSGLFLETKEKPVPGSVITATIEGNRPILAEIQALAAHTPFGMPRRTAVGVDYNRVNMLIAILEKRMGMNFGDQDAYVSAVGGHEDYGTCSGPCHCRRPCFKLPQCARWGGHPLLGGSGAYRRAAPCGTHGPAHQGSSAAGLQALHRAAGQLYERQKSTRWCGRMPDRGRSHWRHVPLN